SEKRDPSKRQFSYAWTSRRSELLNSVAPARSGEEPAPQYPHIPLPASNGAAPASLTASPTRHQPPSQPSDTPNRGIGRKGVQKAPGGRRGHRPSGLTTCRKAAGFARWALWPAGSVTWEAHSPAVAGGRARAPYVTSQAPATY